MPYKNIEEQKKYSREYYQRNKERLRPLQREWTRKWRSSNRFWVNEQSLGYWRKKPTEYKLRQLELARKKYSEKRDLILNKYGHKCVCCGEIRKEFLAVNHINGGGQKERKSIGQRKMYQKILQNNFPNTYNLLCHNCNQAEAFYGYCPHKKYANN